MHPKATTHTDWQAARGGETARGDAQDAASPEGQSLAMVLAYDGSPFQGWQVQPHGPTVQGVLEGALRTVTGGEVKVYGSGRTDTGVHALNQIAHFRAPAPLDLHKLRASLNALAGPAVSVKRIVPVSQAFHARHSATGKTYRYAIFNRPFPPVFGRHRCWWIRTPLDGEAMARAARALVGTHDFSAFRASECAAATPFRTIARLEVRAEADQVSTLAIEIEASGFLQHMARIIAGTLAAVGLGRLAPEEVGTILAGRRREDADATAPGRGLYLASVKYDLREFPELRPLLADMDR